MVWSSQKCRNLVYHAIGWYIYVTYIYTYYVVIVVLQMVWSSQKSWVNVFYLQCGGAFKESDLITINVEGEEEEASQRQAMLERRLQAKLEKVTLDYWKKTHMFAASKFCIFEVHIILLTFYFVVLLYPEMVGRYTKSNSWKHFTWP